jgi:DNA-binding response OmpR family regulator
LLVVEQGDDAVICRQLLEREGLKVLAATSQQAGMQMARQEQPQLVVVDASLPDRGARELALALKLVPRLAHVPVVVITDPGDIQNAPQGQDFAGTVTKPVNRDEFSHTIRDVLERRIRQRVRQQKNRALKLPVVT